MTLTSSDWITIVGAATQVLATLVIGIWQIRSGRPKTSPDVDEGTSVERSFDWYWFLRNAWQFVFCVLTSVFALWLLFSSSEPVTKSFVLQVAFLSIVLVFGVITTFATVAITFLRPNAIKMSRSLDKLRLQSK